MEKDWILSECALLKIIPFPNNSQSDFFSVKSQCDKDLSKALFESLGSCIRRIPFLVQPDVPTTYLLIQVQNCNAFKILDLRIFLISKFNLSKTTKLPYCLVTSEKLTIISDEFFSILKLFFFYFSLS